MGKYLIIVDRSERELAEDFLDDLFSQIPELPNQPANFKKPQRGGNAFKQQRIHKITAYLNKLENAVDEEIGDMMNDEASHSPPKSRNRRFTISYAQAAKTIQFQQPLQSETQKLSQDTELTAKTASTTMSLLTQSLFEDTLNKIKHDSEKSMQSLWSKMMYKMAEMETRITQAVLNALNTPKEINTNNSVDTASAYTTHQDAITVTTLSDKVNELASIVKSLAETIHHRSISPASLPKRNRGTPSAQTTTSPPSKMQRAKPPTPPHTPPPNGHPINQLTRGAREAP